MRVRFALAAISLAAVFAPASAAATTVSVQVRGEVVAGVPVEGDVIVTGAPAGAEVLMILHRGTTECFAPSSFEDLAAAPGADFTLPFRFEQVEGDLPFSTTGPWRLCVAVTTRDAAGNLTAAASTAPLLEARAPRGKLSVLAAHWNPRRHSLRFTLRGRSETRGAVERFLLPGRRRCPRKSPPLFQSPADLGSVGPPDSAPGRFRYTRTVTWRRLAPPPGRYRVCAYLISEAGTGSRGSAIQMARASRLVRVTR
jgi:hypothetical protein